MKVKELRDLLNSMASMPHHDNDEVVIVVKRKNQMGGSPTVKVRGANSGFDWNRGKFMIRTEVDLTEADKE